MTLHQLISDLQAATEGSRELDARIHCLVKEREFVCLSEVGSAYLFFDGAEHLLGSAPAYTASLDAITVLIERAFPGISYSGGMTWVYMAEPPRSNYHTFIHIEIAPGRIVNECGATEALSRCIAFLSALQARGERNG